MRRATSSPVLRAFVVTTRLREGYGGPAGDSERRRDAHHGVSPPKEIKEKPAKKEPAAPREPTVPKKTSKKTGDAAAPAAKPARGSKVKKAKATGSA